MARFVVDEVRNVFENRGEPFSAACYLRYDQRHRSLLSMVETQLLVSHVVFLGFSMTDANLQRASHHVRTMNSGVAAKSTEALVPKEKRGTALMLGDIAPFLCELWPEVDIVPLEEPALGRLPRILDRVATLTSAAGHLLSSGYESNPREAEAVRLMGQLGDVLQDRGTLGRTFDPIRHVLRSYGWSPKTGE
ncbi:MAG: hypothetical protein Q8O67_25765 [Deltaproteobacteria bacterium]|nr:hypothetical protein [Deltaproteobacteria bacterium]